MNSTLGQRPIPQNWIRYIVSFDLDSGSYKRLPGNSSNASSSSATGLTSSTTSTATAFVAGSTGDFSTTSQRSMSSSIIAGSVVGSVACLILLAALLAFLLRRKSAHPRNDVDAAQTPETSGKVETIDPGSSSTKIDHEPIEGSTGSKYQPAQHIVAKGHKLTDLCSNGGDSRSPGPIIPVSSQDQWSSSLQ